MNEINLFHPNTFRILKAVEEKPELTKTEMVERAGSTSAISRLCKILTDEGYITEKSLGRWNKKSYKLTDKGKLALAKMKEIEEIDKGCYDDRNSNASDKKANSSCCKT